MPNVTYITKNLAKLWKDINIVSIGYNCYPSLIINKIKNEPYNLFDWTGSSLWGIKQFIEDDFPVITNEQDLCIYEYYRYFNNQTIYITTNKKYFIRFFHDFKKSLNKLPEITEDFKDKTFRRSIRLQNILKETKPLLLVHLEDVNNRTNYTMNGHEKHYPKITNDSQYIEQYSKISINDAIELIDLIITKYNNKNVLMIYFSMYLTTQHIESKNIFIINLGLDFTSYENKDICKLKILELLWQYSQNISEIIN
jgi:hypothetical protein